MSEGYPKAHPGINHDRMVRASNRSQGKPLCSRCGGTGNELLFMYRQCAQCGGTGVARPPGPQQGPQQDSCPSCGAPSHESRRTCEGHS